MGSSDLVNSLQDVSDANGVRVPKVRDVLFPSVLICTLMDSTVIECGMSTSDLSGVTSAGVSCLVRVFGKGKVLLPSFMTVEETFTTSTFLAGDWASSFPGSCLVAGDTLRDSGLTEGGGGLLLSGCGGDGDLAGSGEGDTFGGSTRAVAAVHEVEASSFTSGVTGRDSPDF